MKGRPFDVVLKEIKSEVNDIIKGATQNVKGQTALLLQMATQYKADSMERVFTDGINSAGTPIGDYAEATKEYRLKRGRPPGFVNLDDTGQLKASYAVGITGDASEVGFIAIRRVTPKGKPSKATNTEILKSLKKRYGEIFIPTDDEDKRLDVIIDSWINKMI